MADGPVMRPDRHSLMAFGGIAALAAGAAMLLADGGAVFAPVTGMVGGIAAMALANHERLKLRIEVLEKRLAQAEWRGQPRRSNSGSGNLRFRYLAAVPGSSGIGEHNDHPIGHRNPVIPRRYGAFAQI